MEVMNVGQSFALFLSKNEKFQKYTGLSENDILHDVMAALKTACLVHDIGNPSFGHFGKMQFKIILHTFLMKLKMKYLKKVMSRIHNLIM